MADHALREALRNIGADETLRRRFVELALDAEARLAREGYDVREAVTGPLVDALYAQSDLVRVTLADGTLFEVPYRSKIARDLAMRSVEHPDHVFEPQTTKLLLALCKGARHVVIGGAYAGDHAVLAARAIAAHGGVVHAFEPNPEQMAFLHRNAELNGVTNVRFNACALWERGNVRLRLVGTDAYARTIETASDDPEGIDVTTIDDYARANAIERVDAIMLDVEGGELPIFKGARETLSRDSHGPPAVIYEVNNAYVDWSLGLHRTETVAFLAGYGYESFAIRDYQSNVDLRGYPVELVPVEGAYVEGPRHGFNVLGIRDRSLLTAAGARLTPGLSPKLLRHRDPAMHGPNR